VISTLTFTAVLLLAIALYAWWERSDRQKEQVALQVATDIQALGDVVATSLSPSIDPNVCIGSGACVAACPEKGVIGLVGGRAQLLNPLGCIGHGACASACPLTAIRLVYGTKTRGVELPQVDQNFQTNRPGVYIAGELGGMGLIRNAVIQGRQAADHIIDGSPGSGAPPRRGRGDALDVIVVGAGPAGISATLRLMEAGLRVLLLDREGFGGTILHYPRAKVVMTGTLDLPMYGKFSRRQVSKEELLSLWREIYERTQPPFVTGELVTGLAPRADGMWSLVSDRATRAAANVILALGGRGSPQKLGVTGEESSKVAYRLLEPAEFTGKHVLVVGGGNSAVESAVTLADHGGCASVAISYRRAEFARCRAQNRERITSAIARGAVQALLSTEVKQITGRSLLLQDAQGQLQQLANDAVLVQIGGTPPAHLLGSLGITLVTKYGER
jgi:thioredoxin reductase/NAD-dependent dihydropyrimidine dehydrogenase PreA subunit